MLWATDVSHCIIIWYHYIHLFIRRIYISSYWYTILDFINTFQCSIWTFDVFSFGTIIENKNNTTKTISDIWIIGHMELGYILLILVSRMYGRWCCLSIHVPYWFQICILLSDIWIFLCNMIIVYWLHHQWYKCNIN